MPKRQLKTLLLNLPNRNQVVRRYMCSYLAPNFLLPPQELIALGAVARDWKKQEVKLLDCIAENYKTDDVRRYIAEFQPQVIISISGFECFEEDMNEITAIKQQFPEVTFLLFGHYATLFYKEILTQVPVDYILLGEPDLIFSSLYDLLSGECAPEDVKGIAYRNAQGEVVMRASDGRIPDPNQLPMPAYDLLPAKKYFEPFLPAPFGMIQSARGCPYQCNYCVKSFGTKLTMLTPERILEDILFLKKHHGIKSLRFIDDTFTAIPKRVIKLCQLMVEAKVDLTWTCLSRADTISEEMLMWMQKAGCKRLYIGVESGSQSMLDYYNKGVDAEASIQNLLLCKKYGIETAAFFLAGMPNETREDFEASINYAIRSQLDYVLVSELTPYPGTALFEKLRSDIDFSVLPYRNELKREPGHAENYKKLEKEFYRRFYMRPGYIFGSAKRLIRNFREVLVTGFNLIRFMMENKGMIFPNYKMGFGKNDKVFKPTPYMHSTAEETA
jgi:anaerobic magnesium-protoporphyrin IX monomethyl ester cyclase